MEKSQKIMEQKAYLKYMVRVKPESKHYNLSPCRSSKEKLFLSWDLLAVEKRRY